MIAARKHSQPDPSSVDLDRIETCVPVTAPVIAAGVDAMAVDSPARRLQQGLAQALGAPEREPRWSARRTLGFVLLTNGLFWIGLVSAARAWL